MMNPSFTVLIPTFNHGPTLRYSIGSVLKQTVEDFELFVIGDGVPEISRQIISEFQAQDSRVRFFDHPKGPRHGEIYRHAALAEARGEVVVYHSDDDIMFPHHLATVAELIEGHDFVHTLPTNINPAGELVVWNVDLSLPAFRRLICEVENRIPLCVAAHTLEFYRRLPYGWRTTPPGIFTDWYMWQQVLGVRDCRARSGFEMTMLHFASSQRGDVCMQDRLKELDKWQRVVDDPAQRAELMRLAKDALRATRNNDFERLIHLEIQTQAMQQEAQALQHELQRMQSTRIWRLRNRLRQVPLFKRLLAR